MSREPATAKVFRVDLGEPLRPLEVEAGYREVVLVVVARGRALGQVTLPAVGVVPVDVQRAFIVRQLADALWRQELELLLLRAVGADVAPEFFACPPVSVVVCTRDRPGDLERCLTSLGRLDPAPHEVLVIDNCPTTAVTLQLCERFPVRYVLEPIPGRARARNRGIVEATGEAIAFTDDDCVAEPTWLATLGREFADPRVHAVTGVVAPFELDTPAQYLFEAHGGFGRGFERRLFDGVRVDAAIASGCVGAGANAVFRRRTFDEVGLFSEWLGPGTPARAADDNDIFGRILDAGYSIVYAPELLVWHRHRREDASLRQILNEHGSSSTAFAIDRLLARHDWGAGRILAWWWLHHLPAELAGIVRRRPTRMPLACVAAEAAGTLAGPWRLWRSRRSRRRIEPIALPDRREAPFRQRLAVGFEMPGLSVVIPSCDRRASLEGVFAGLAAQVYPDDRFEAIVVLDGSADDSAEMLRAADTPFRLDVVEQEKGGVAAARNAGLRAATQPLVVFLDDDIVPEPQCLAAHASAHARAAGQLVALGYCPPVVDDGWWGLALRARWEDRYRRKSEPGHRWSYVDYTTGNSSLPRELLLDLGGFDEAFTMRHEDWELAVRLLERRVPFGYYPETLAWHHLDATLAAAVRRQRHEARDDIRLARRHPALGAELPLAAHRRQGSAPSERTLARGLRQAARLERARLYGAWRNRTRSLLAAAYALGLRDEIPSDEEFHALLADVLRRPPARVDVELFGDGSVDFPPVGAVELVLQVEGRGVARLAPESGAGWDWPGVVRRFERGAPGEIRAAVASRLLADRDAVDEQPRLEVADVR